MLRKVMSAAGKDGSRYGAHSCRIGGATALAFSKASEAVIKDMGRWKSDAYLRYIRECRGEYMQFANAICNARVDDMEADCTSFESHDVDESDYE